MFTEKPFLAPSKAILWVILVSIFSLGLLIRFYDLFDYPLDFHSPRQLHSAIIARGMYYQNLDEAEDWQREIAVQQWKSKPHIEPQLLERVVAITYRLVGSEVLWVARIYSILFWIVGGVGLFLLAKDIFGMDGAFISLIYYLILPYGAIASRSFQPDPLMVSLIIFTYLAMVRWHRNQTWRNAILAGLLGGGAIFVKSVAVFFVGGAWVGIILSGIGFRDALRSRKVWTIAGLTVLPYLCYHVYGVYISGFLKSEFSLRFFPQLWRDPIWYLRWNGELSSVVGFEWFLVALLGTFALKKAAHRGMFIGFWVGYFLYGMTLSYHIYTHDYYQLPLIPLVALGLGSCASIFFRNLSGSKKLMYPVIVGVILFAIILKAWDVRVALKRMDYQGEVAFWQNLGTEIGRDADIIGLTQDSGDRLAYFGWVDSEIWMASGDFNVRELAGQEFDMKILFEEEIADKDLFVVTLFNELESQPELQLLLSNYEIYKETDDYLIYDLKHPASEGANP
ncbi:MAG: glycosyltransferase family 39 protein [Anaerolineaceae bacterium]|nr:glycosyltransferase family 39 protein [Anaerolineaceae bacterium]